MAQSLFARLTRRYHPESEFDRRQFLKIALAASAGLLISDHGLLAGSVHHKNRGRKIIVIGGGLSGLACAYELMHAGCEVTVLESRNRLGGRVISFHDMVKDKSIEGGGEYIGKNHPTWLAYARKFDLQLFEGDADDGVDQPVLIDGRTLTSKEAKGLLEEMGAANKHMAKDAANINADEPWNSPEAARLDRMNTASWLRDLPLSHLCKIALGSQLEGNNGSALHRQSYLGNLAQVKGGGLEKYWTDSEIYRCRGGNQSLALKFGRALGDNLKLEMPVDRLDVKNDRVSVTCANGDVHEGDDIVLAVPPSVWHRIKFEPGLPSELTPSMGTVVKYLSVLDSRFWKEEHLGPNASTDGMVSMTWDAGEGQKGEKTVLASFSGGPAAERCRDRWTRRKDVAYTEELAKLYPGYAGHFKHSRFMDWPADQWLQAGYSFPAPGEVTTVGPRLSEGVGRLHFAGEHTCYKFVGYMEGALNSGVSLAKRLTTHESKKAAAVS